MKKWFISLVLAGMVCNADAQYIPAQGPVKKQKTPVSYDYWHPGNTFQHLDVSVSVGTTGIGIDLATPLCEFLQLRAGYDYMPPFRKTFHNKVVVGGQTAPQYDANGFRVETPFDRVANRMWTSTGYDMKEQVDLIGKLTMQNVKIMIDCFPFEKKNWHFTAGLYWGLSRVIDVKNTGSSSATLTCIGRYNQMYDGADPTDEIRTYGKIYIQTGEYDKGGAYQMMPDANDEIRMEGKTSRFKPYVGFGYGGRLLKKRTDWKISFDCGALFWGGSPDMIVHDGTNLTDDVKNIPGTGGKYMDVVKALKVYPQLSVRLSKTLF